MKGAPAIFLILFLINYGLAFEPAPKSVCDRYLDDFGLTCENVFVDYGQQVSCVYNPYDQKVKNCLFWDESFMNTSFEWKKFGKSLTTQEGSFSYGIVIIAEYGARTLLFFGFQRLFDQFHTNVALHGVVAIGGILIFYAMKYSLLAIKKMIDYIKAKFFPEVEPQIQRQILNNLPEDQDLFVNN